MNVFLVAIGGAIGASSRYLLGGWIQSQLGPDFPWGTFLINVSGSFLIGIVLGLSERGLVSGQARLLLAVGMLGGYTTFSSFSWENLQLADNSGAVPLLLNVAGQVILGFIAAYLGLVIARVLGGV